ncbi:hypothetical protein [Hamadaea tsunoensis]|uniref:hypothetical protein n=1 Tax=Hamadaea tsunoensis TaxID=53368 RepID=UPI0003F8B4B2|nr:hypothetical protein [Hamadaea tsunoensis]
MGVEYEYFRAKDDTAAMELVDRLGEDGVESVYTKWIEPAVTVGSLVAYVRGSEWTEETVDLGPSLPEDGDEEGPWTFSVDDGVRDTLALIEDERLRELAVWWSRAPELARSGMALEEELLPILSRLIQLARRAQAAELHLYCRCNL